ncbi:transformation/transcription domain-associated protein-like [Mercenaria mercenaria]|uniref:transformation/transcription domain-associated protein-like n=1 Tax=Mercenaria mercenaria TaxID=6596 RepID=UPI00234F136B|nr:transformation/transcription domain-associated protein-like [Mercenaria mercenaria]
MEEIIGSGDATPGSMKRAGSVDPPGKVKKARYSSGALGSPGPAIKWTESGKPIVKQYCDGVVNFLLKVACQVSEVAGLPGEVLWRRCVALLKMALRQDVWLGLISCRKSAARFQQHMYSLRLIVLPSNYTDIPMAVSMKEHGFVMKTLSMNQSSTCISLIQMRE